MLEVLEYCNSRVLTTAQLAESMQTDKKIITQNFRRNKDMFEQGIHFYVLTGEKLKQFKGMLQDEASLKFTATLYLWTERGAWVHANALNTEQARKAISTLLEQYYAITHTQKVQEQPQTLVISYEKFEEFERRVEALEQLARNATLHTGEQARLRKAVGARVCELTDNSGARNALFRALYAGLKERYHVGSYRDIKQYELQDAIRFVANWRG